MKKPYTHDFLPNDAPSAPSGHLEGVAFILYQHGFHARIPDWRYAGVLSPYWRLLHCPRGTAAVVYEGEPLALDAGSLVLIPADVETDLKSGGAIDMLYAHFLPLLPLALEPILSFRQPQQLTTNTASRGLLDHLRQLPAGEPTRALHMRALLEVCFAELLRPHVAAAAARPPPDPRVIRMLACLRERYASPLDNAAVAAAAGLGPDQAMRLCRRVTGRTLHDHLLGIRLAEASRLLTTHEASIKQVAAACGFANRFHFTRVFAQRMGIGPAAFRERFRTGGRVLSTP